MSGVRRVALIMVFSFVFLSLGLVYWQVVKADTMLDHPANRRAVFLQERITRGTIFDRNGVVLAQTKVIEDRKVRVYPQREMFQPLLGYATVKYGSAGLEAAKAETLLGFNDISFIHRL
jgi:peptidoglycan glycosyltransferase